MQRAVALKTLHPRPLQDPDHLGRVYREAKAASLLDGPKIVRVYDFGVDESTSTPFIALELVRGTRLRTRVAAVGVMRTRQAVAAQVCRAHIEAQAAGIVHRDLKSDNILLVAGPIGAATVRVVVRADVARATSASASSGRSAPVPVYVGTRDAPCSAVSQRKGCWSPAG